MKDYRNFVHMPCLYFKKIAFYSKIWKWGIAQMVKNKNKQVTLSRLIYPSLATENVKKRFDHLYKNEKITFQMANLNWR